MSETVLNKKKSRALLNTLREACVYRNELMLMSSDSKFEVIAHELIEKGYRDVAEEKILVVKSDQKLPDSVELMLKEQNEAYSFDLKKESSDQDTHKFKINVSNANPENRRSSNRKRQNESYYIPALLYLKDQNFYPISMHVRLLDFDAKAVSYQIRVPTKVSESDLIGATIKSSREAFADRSDTVKIDLIRNIKNEDYFGDCLVQATAVSMLEEKEHGEEDEPSLIQPQKDFYIQIKCFLVTHTTFDLKVDQITKNGFSSSLTELETKNLPKYFLAEHTESHIRFNVENVRHKLIFRLVSNDIGLRAQWYNYITEKALNIQSKFKPEDVQDVTRLMLESGNYNQRSMSNIVLLHDYLKSKWPIEESLSRTKFRWLARDSSGAIVGHTSGMQVSDSLWAAIDNIGSQSYAGSWNREFVSKWIRSFVELLGEKNEKALVQWTYVPEANVWNRFEERLREHPDLLICKDRFWSYIFDNDNSSNIFHRRKNFSSRKIASGKNEIEKWADNSLIRSKTLFEVITNGISGDSEFLNNFKLDYGFKFERHFRLIEKNGSLAYLLTYSNYPYWASLNKTHDWAYLFPLNRNHHSELELSELISLIKTEIIESGCIPYRIAIVDEKENLKAGLGCTNLFVKPAAILFAAESIEG